MATGGPRSTEPPASMEAEAASTTQAVSTTEAPVLPGFYTDPNFVLSDSSATWRFGKPPDYSKTRRLFSETKSKNHEAGSLPQLVENLVKNWEIEASFKTKLGDWQTVNPSKYTFSMNGGTPQKGEHMLEVGSYNSIIAPNEYYSPEYSDFASTHKTFKRMMPFFAWEVLEVYSGPPKVAFRWRHWGQMKNDYVGFNNRAEKVTAKAHGGWIDIQGITVADLDEDMKIVHLETWFDPMDMFRQIAPKGIVNKQPMTIKITVGSPKEANSDTIPEVKASLASTLQVQQKGQALADHEPAGPLLPHESSQDNLAKRKANENPSKPVVGEKEKNEDICAVENCGAPLTHHSPTGNEPPEDDLEFWDAHEHPIPNAEAKMQDPSLKVEEEETAPLPIPSNSQMKSQNEENGNIREFDRHFIDKQTTSIPECADTDAAVNPEQSKEDAIKESDMGMAETQMTPDEGEAVAVSDRSVETIMTHEEMSRITPAECPFFNRE